jgi:hypothetical protein
MRLNIKAFALTCGLIWGFGLFLLTWWIHLYRPHLSGLQPESYWQLYRLDMGIDRRLYRWSSLRLALQSNHWTHIETESIAGLWPVYVSKLSLLPLVREEL